MIRRRALLAAAAALPAAGLPLPLRAAETPRPPPLPAPRRSAHTLDLPGRSLRFTAEAGAFSLGAADETAAGEIAYTAYMLDDAPAPRPVSFVVNGGPGAASAWLQLGALGPWRVAMQPLPSTPPVLVPNAETWLDVTDLVFLDPPGTGFARAASAEAEKTLYAVQGDIAALAAAIRRWMVAAGRLGSPVHLVGESYGGFRVPRLARALADGQGIGARGIVLVSRPSISPTATSPTTRSAGRCACRCLRRPIAAPPGRSGAPISPRPRPMRSAPISRRC